MAIGGVLGLASAAWVMKLLTKLIPTDMIGNMPYLQSLGLNLHVMTFACAVSLTAGVFFALTPTLRVSLSNLREGLTEGSRGSTGKWRRFRLHRETGSNEPILHPNYLCPLWRISSYVKVQSFEFPNAPGSNSVKISKFRIRCNSTGICKRSCKFA